MEGKRARPYYELIAEGCPARLYFDIEGVYPGEKPSDEKFEKAKTGAKKSASAKSGVDEVDRTRTSLL